jgi:large subunit ribosomal protein L30e
MAVLNRNLRICVKTGKIEIGKKNILRTLRTHTGKLLILAENLPELYRKEMLHHIAKQNRKIDVFTYPGSSWDLGNHVGKPYMVGAMLVQQAGDSKILDVIKEF